MADLQTELSQLPSGTPTPAPQPIALQKPTGTGIFAQPVDKQALALARAIALKESGNGSAPNYTVVGDNGTAAGSGQWSNQNAQGVAQPLAPGQIPNNFKTEASQYGLDPNDFSPENQDKVLYAEVYTNKQKGLSPAQIAAAHNAGMKRALDGSWQQNIGTTTLNGKQIAYNTPAYVDQVKALFDKQLSQLGGPVQSAQGASDTTQSQPTTPDTLGQKTPGHPDFVPAKGSTPSVSALKQNLANLPGQVAGAANAVLPILGDVGGDINGSNSKTALQQGGDAVQSALSAALLIPGAQPEDLAAKAGLEGVTARIGANAAAGGLIGASNAVGQGKSGGQVAEQGLLGAGLGGVASGAIEGLLKIPSVAARLQQAIQDTMPLADKSTRIEALQNSLPTGEGVQRTGLLGTSSIQPNVHDVEVGQSALPYVQGTKDPLVKIQNVNQGIKTMSQDTDNFLDENSSPSNFADMRDYVESNNQPAPGLKDDPSAFDAFKRTSERALGTLNKVMRDTAKATEDFGPTTPGSDIRQARIAIDQQIKTELKGATLGSPQYTGIKAAAVSARNVLNRMSEDLLRYPGQLEQLNRFNGDLSALKERGIEITPEAQAALKAKYGLVSTAESEANAARLSAQHKVMSNLYEARDNLIDNYQRRVGKNKIEETIENSPIAKTAVGLVKKSLPFGIGTHL